MAASGRFLHLLADGERERLAGLYGGLPVVTRGALAAQLSFPPRHPRADNVTRVPRMLTLRSLTGSFQMAADTRFEARFRAAAVRYSSVERMFRVPEIHGRARTASAGAVCRPPGGAAC